MFIIDLSCFRESNLIYRVFYLFININYQWKHPQNHLCDYFCIFYIYFGTKLNCYLQILIRFPSNKFYALVSYFFLNAIIFTFLDNFDVITQLSAFKCKLSAFHTNYKFINLIFSDFALRNSDRIHYYY